MAINYTNAEIRSILNGLGIRSRVFSGDRTNPTFPYTEDNSALTDTVTQNAIRKFQTEHNLSVYGIVGPVTTAKLEQVMRILHRELNAVVDPSFPTDQPFYGLQTIATVRMYQRQLAEDGIATLPVREKLYEKSGGTVTSEQAESLAV
jgi:peptidoglycan hydrolase-like protein with peptidoglycan-binding domain